MKRFLACTLCCLLVCLQMVPCFGASSATDAQIEVNEDGSFFIICEDLRDVDIPGIPEVDEEATDTESSGPSSGITSNGNINFFIKLFNEIINTLKKLLSQFTVQKKVTKTKYVYYFSSTSQLLWYGTLNADFIYSDSYAKCVNAKADFKTYDDNWNLENAVCTYESATASATFFVEQRSLGVKLQIIEKTLTLTCDTNGNVS